MATTSLKGKVIVVTGGATGIGAAIARTAAMAGANVVVDYVVNAAQAGQLLNAAIPLGAIATPEQIGDVVAFLASDAASYLTATTVVVDGGLMQSSLGL